jgi:hypothetical protein
MKRDWRKLLTIIPLPMNHITSGMIRRDFVRAGAVGLAA